MDFWPSSWKDSSVVWWVTIIVTVVLSLVLLVVMLVRSASKKDKQINAELIRSLNSIQSIDRLRNQFYDDAPRLDYVETAVESLKDQETVDHFQLKVPSTRLGDREDKMVEIVMAIETNPLKSVVRSCYSTLAQNSGAVFMHILKATGKLTILDPRENLIDTMRWFYQLDDNVMCGLAVKNPIIALDVDASPFDEPQLVLSEGLLVFSAKEKKGVFSFTITKLPNYIPITEPLRQFKQYPDFRVIFIKNQGELKKLYNFYSTSPLSNSDTISIRLEYDHIGFSKLSSGDARSNSVNKNPDSEAYNRTEESKIRKSVQNLKKKREGDGEDRQSVGDLPNDVSELIRSQLTKENLLSLGQTSKGMRSTVQNNIKRRLVDQAAAIPSDGALSLSRKSKWRKEGEKGEDEYSSGDEV